MRSFCNGVNRNIYNTISYCFQNLKFKESLSKKSETSSNKKVHRIFSWQTHLNLFSLFLKISRSRDIRRPPIIPIAFRRKSKHLPIKNYSTALADQLIVSNYCSKRGATYKRGRPVTNPHSDSEGGSVHTSSLRRKFLGEYWITSSAYVSSFEISINLEIKQ